MTDMKVRDGTGSGRTAQVDSKYNLHTLATTYTEEHIVSAEDGQSYFSNTADTANTLTLADGNTYNMLYLKNSSETKNLVVEKVLVSADTAGLVMRWIRSPTLGTVSANNVHTPANLNFSSSNTADGVFHNWDETGTSGIGGLSGGTTVKTFQVPQYFTVFPIDGAIVMPNGASMVVELTNNTGGAVEAECGIRFYFEPKE